MCNHIILKKSTFSIKKKIKDVEKLEMLFLFFILPMLVAFIFNSLNEEKNHYIVL